MKFFTMISLLLCYFMGALTVVILEAVALFFVVRRLGQRRRCPNSESCAPELDANQSLHFLLNKQGVIWVLEPDKIPMVFPNEPRSKSGKEPKSKKETVEVFPVKKYAKIQDRNLILTDLDGSEAIIELEGCRIMAVSAGPSSSRKWAKRYPIILESKNAAILNGKKTCYIYLETSWEKESWCKALRLTSNMEKENLNRYKNINKEFHHYLSSLNAEYPSFLKPSTGFGEPKDRVNRIDGPSSKVRVLLKKLANKASKKGGVGNKVGSPLNSNREEKKNSDRSRLIRDSSSASGLTKAASTNKLTSISLEPDAMLPSSSFLANYRSQSQNSTLSDAESDTGGCTSSDSIHDRPPISDEGTLCCNLLFSRLFFDAKRSARLTSSIRMLVERALSNLRTPSFVRGITCSELDVGNLPPHIHNIRILPVDLNEMCAAEIDIEYCGGALLDIETRLEVREPDFKRDLVDTSLEESTVGEATAHLLEGVEYFGDQLRFTEDATGGTENRGGLDKPDLMQSTGWKSTYASRWKSILNSVADHVSQVPLSLAIRVTSLRGTLRIHIKPPPSDRLWFGFTSMPDIEWDLESSVGEHKITSAQIALLISNRIKAGLHETLVLPNCESVCIPWMLADKDDWVPKKAAPFTWVHQEVGEPNGSNRYEHHPVGVIRPRAEAEHEINHSTDSSLRPKDAPYPTQPTDEVSFSMGAAMPPSSSSQSMHSHGRLEDLKLPLLTSEEEMETKSIDRSETSDSTQAAILRGDEHRINYAAENDKSKSVGRRARMMDFSKKMGEKLEEKRRHLEEKSKHLVEKMKGYEI
ncbi:testis-expressed protein 2 isoform X1 [Amborella trichopoda]|nr:testis-expressed protein 2 isoform X1 [Amborella trichopoda]|eukprot:XP_006848627.2 testis-expressed protein 2 isoform X1 [Amborella trichopoda]